MVSSPNVIYLASVDIPQVTETSKSDRKKFFYNFHSLEVFLSFQSFVTRNVIMWAWERSFAQVLRVYYIFSISPENPSGMRVSYCHLPVQPMSNLYHFILYPSPWHRATHTARSQWILGWMNEQIYARMRIPNTLWHYSSDWTMSRHLPSMCLNFLIPIMTRDFSPSPSYFQFKHSYFMEGGGKKQTVDWMSHTFQLLNKKNLNF